MIYTGFDLSGRVAVLTGSTSGMGLAIARGFAQCGAKVVVSSNIQTDTDRAAQLLRDEGFEAKGVRCDVTNVEDINSFCDTSRRAFGRVDIVVCQAAGPAPVGAIADIHVDELDAWLLTTIRNNLILIRQFLPEMKEQRYGSVLVMSSIASLRASAALGAYGAAKAAMNSVVRSIAAEWGQWNIRANALAPSMVRTGFSQAFWTNPDSEKAIAAKSPANRLAEPEDIVGAAILLASPAGSYISGQTLLIDGGRSII
ncbi:SDR family NAD(P)-dependent oxidoreductase [Paraburkholderia aspalathi]|uniref:NAD(P)-dependent dehydrogenase, short-chain alcohol dehydrogenase family n=1 Tax=Paraburkholderia aspalathi TaxID=1324617 RepID=A0A1I7CLK6_9BURK|nr:SDR family oxidoreductase [Paraburkholderia aspalathi]SFU00321.1 NAD(P)-dependent dehydrogenase, short-chain alcohol dehydrogenase family [Paraburkholderia aspalathi]